MSTHGTSNEYPQHMITWINKKNTLWATPLIWSFGLTFSMQHQQVLMSGKLYLQMAKLYSKGISSNVKGSSIRTDRPEQILQNEIYTIFKHNYR